MEIYFASYLLLMVHIFACIYGTAIASVICEVGDGDGDVTYFNNKNLMRMA